MTHEGEFSAPRDSIHDPLRYRVGSAEIPVSI